MRYFLLAALPIALSFACAHQQSASINDQTSTTSGNYARDAGVVAPPSQGWDNSRSQQAQDAPPPVTNDSISR